MYNLFKFLHVLTVVVWIGGTISLKVLTARIAKTNDRGLIAAVAAQNEVIAKQLLGPCSILLLVFGVATVFGSSPALFKEPWVALGVVGWILLAGIGHGMITPQSRRLRRVIEGSGPSHPDAGRILRRLDRLSRVEITLFVLLIADMVFKPGMR